MGGDCYRKTHNASLMKASARLSEAREFVLAYDTEKSVAENGEIALRSRWYGNASVAVCSELTRFFNDRFNIKSGHLPLLRRFLSAADVRTFPAINHFYMVLTDPYYRWAAAEYCADRLDSGLTEIPRSGFETEARSVLPDILGPKTVNRYCRNMLTALRDNGYLSGLTKKEISSPAISARTLAFMLYSLSDLGEGFNDFDGSPLFRALLKSRDLLEPVFREGEKNGYWEFTGDRNRLSGHLALNGLASFVAEVAR